MPGRRCGSTASQLQDMHELSVNWLLWLLWLEAQGRQATPALLDRAEADTGRLRRQLIEPLRQMRRSLDQQDEAPLRRQIGRVELTAERLELRRLQRLRPLAVPITAVDNPCMAICTGWRRSIRHRSSRCWRHCGCGCWRTPRLRCKTERHRREYATLH